MLLQIYLLLRGYSKESCRKWLDQFWKVNNFYFSSHCYAIILLGNCSNPSQFYPIPPFPSCDFHISCLLPVTTEELAAQYNYYYTLTARVYGRSHKKWKISQKYEMLTTNYDVTGEAGCRILKNLLSLQYSGDRPFYWRGGLCLLVELHWEGSAPAACAAGLFMILWRSGGKGWLT